MSYIYSKPNHILLLKDQIVSLQRDRLREKDPWKKYELNSKTEKLITKIKQLEKEVEEENKLLEKLPRAPKHIIQLKEEEEDEFDIDPQIMQEILEKAKNKFRHKSRKSRKVSRKTKKSVRKSRKASRKTKKSFRKSKKTSKKAKKSVRKSRKVSRKTKKSVCSKSRKASRKRKVTRK